MDNYNEMTFDQLTAVKVEVTELLKEQKEAHKEAEKQAKAEAQEVRADEGRKLAKIGAIVRLYLQESRSAWYYR